VVVSLKKSHKWSGDTKKKRCAPLLSLRETQGRGRMWGTWSSRVLVVGCEMAQALWTWNRAITQWLNSLSFPKEMKIYVHTKSYTQMFTAALLIMARKVGTTQMSTNWAMNKQKMAYLYPGMIIRNKKEWSMDHCYDLGEPWKLFMLIKKRKLDHLHTMPPTG
jgi:hypothetical protein